MPNDTAAANDEILSGVLEQVRDLQPSFVEQISVDAILKELENLASLMGGAPDDPPVKLLTEVVQQIGEIKDGKKNKADLGPVLGDLDSLKFLISKTASAECIKILTSVIARTLQLLNYRPDVTAILGDLEEIKTLKGGPADATAFHDFHVLQIAFKNIWVQLADENLKDKAAQLYDETVRLYEGAGVPAPDFGEINDIADLKQFLKTVQDVLGSNVSPKQLNPTVSGLGPFIGGGVVVAAPPPLSYPMPPEAASAYPGLDLFWANLTREQQTAVQTYTGIINDASASREQKEEAKNNIAAVLSASQGSNSRLLKLMLEIGSALSEPYAFDVFAPDSYNYGIMLTYRQKWEPGEYQAGDLSSTITLAPGETRKYSKKRTVKATRAQKEMEKSMSSRSTQSSETSRAESEIMKKASTATNFKMTTEGSFNIGIGSFNSSTEFALNQAQESASNKKDFHEATLKAAEEYRLERSLEVDTTASAETEETYSGEISNPNNEITVTYLFYELQRRYKISEFLYRARPVILIAQEVPPPHQIDEAWLLQYQWIISRVLLDDSFRTALSYLSSGLAGDEVSLAVMRAQWQAQAELTKKLEAQTQDLLDSREYLRTLISEDITKKAINDLNSDDLFNPFAKPFDPIGKLDDYQKNAHDSALLEINRRAAETRLKYVEDALVDAQNKLKQATDSFQRATQQYSAALQQQYSRQVAIDQLRLHVKQNILYYMQAIWAHEVPDQRFFRLYNKKVACSKPQPDCAPVPKVVKQGLLAPSQRGLSNLGTIRINIGLCPPVASTEVDLVEMADLDNPLGYKGNYIVFPLKQHCYLTDYMLHEYIDDYFGVRDPDPYGDLSIEELGNEVNRVINDPASSDDDKAKIKEEFLKYLTMARRTTDEIIVPTGQLFIEALPGSHPLLEDFKLLHRAEDVRKVKAEVRHAELENLRLAARLIAGERQDPEIEKRIVVDKGINVVDENP